MQQCQSCAMPLSKDPNGGGSESNGTLSTKYCSYCYGEGKFTRECTCSEMQEFVANTMKEKEFGRIMRTLSKRQIPTLERRDKR